MARQIQYLVSASTKDERARMTLWGGRKLRSQKEAEVWVKMELIGRARIGADYGCNHRPQLMAKLHVLAAWRLSKWFCCTCVAVNGIRHKPARVTHAASHFLSAHYIAYRTRPMQRYIAMSADHYNAKAVKTYPTRCRFCTFCGNQI